MDMTQSDYPYIILFSNTSLARTHVDWRVDLINMNSNAALTIGPVQAERQASSLGSLSLAGRCEAVASESIQ